MPIRLVLRAALPLALGVAVMATPVYAAGPNPVTIQIHDACDPATFNAAIGPGTCSRQGGVTFAHFLDEVDHLGLAPAWRFTPGQLHVSVDQPFVATNMGGEVHTFTEVDKFGGGIAPFLNGPSGFSTPAPECTDGSPGGFTADHRPLLAPSTTFLATALVPGATSVADSEDEVGHTFLYQCCIHPWMHEMITVDPK